APEGHIHPSLVFGLFPNDIDGQTKMLELKKVELEKETQMHDTGVPHEHHSHLEEDKIETFTISTDKMYDAPKLIEVLSDLPQQIFRVKGFVCVISDNGRKMMVVNGVNRQI